MMRSNANRILGIPMKLGLRHVLFFICLCSFLTGFFIGFSIVMSLDGYEIRFKHRLLESIEAKDESMIRGESGDSLLNSIPFQVLSWKPRIVYFPKFASAEQCQIIIKFAKPRLNPSSLALRKGETAESTKGIRTSSGAFISAWEETTGVLAYVEEKIARATMVPRNYGEDFNILRYETGQQYASHYDAFDPALYGPQESQRIASFLLYLSNVEEGGETMFPRENDRKNVEGSCIGLKVKPKQGDGILFYSVFPNGTIDQRSLHGSCPVIRGEKWVATKWIRNQLQQYTEEE